MGFALVQVEQHPEHVQTLGALQRTMLHLRTFMDAPGASLADIQMFLWDCYRGVRQDLYVQGMQVRRHLLACHTPALLSSKASQERYAVR